MHKTKEINRKCYSFYDSTVDNVSLGVKEFYSLEQLASKKQIYKNKNKFKKIRPNPVFVSREKSTKHDVISFR